MISMKVHDENGEVVPGIEPQTNIWSPRTEINAIKQALKKDHLYTDDELRHLKSRLRDMYTVNKQLKRGNGFGRAS
jgi:histidinol-phosphate/aromatic aminotransferase/cobyric acid decarboxylase-like protein